MVPEMKTSFPMLAPWLIPEITRSTGSSMRASRATMVQSAGVPSTAYTISAQADIDVDATLQSWGYMKPAPGLILGVASTGCPNTGVWDATLATATVIDTVGPCNATSGQSAF